MMAARSNFLELGKDVEDHVKPHHDHLSHSEKRHQVAEEFARRLSDLRTQKLRSYIELMSLCGFFETAGTLVYKGYIDRDDIMQLYDGTIEQLFTATRIHIERRQEEMPPGYLENFKRLAESIPPSPDFLANRLPLVDSDDVPHVRVSSWRGQRLGKAALLSLHRREMVTAARSAHHLNCASRSNRPSRPCEREMVGHTTFYQRFTMA